MVFADAAVLAQPQQISFSLESGEHQAVKAKNKKSVNVCHNFNLIYIIVKIKALLNFTKLAQNMNTVDHV